MYRIVQKKGTVLLSTSLVWPALVGCSRVETFSQLRAIYFAQPCTRFRHQLYTYSKIKYRFFNLHRNISSIVGGSVGDGVALAVGFSAVG